MIPDRDREEAVFRQAIQRPKGPERLAFINQACADDPVLRARLGALVQAHEGPAPFLEGATLARTPDEGPGTLIGRYRILEKIGEGGFGIVYVAEASMFGAEYAMRVWLDPDKLNSYGLTASDVTSAISAQNTDVSVGQLGDLPAIGGQELNVTLRAQSTLRTPAEFQNILLRVNPTGSRVKLRDVARVEMGGQSYNMAARANGQPGVGIGIKLASGANVLSTATAVQTRMRGLSRFFPAGIAVTYPMNSSDFIKISMAFFSGSVGTIYRQFFVGGCLPLFCPRRTRASS
ncbi:MAG TPA: efflux RND transporter permease subunit [Verrucomicrobiae bacterium]